MLLVVAARMVLQLAASPPAHGPTGDKDEDGYEDFEAGGSGENGMDGGSGGGDEAFEDGAASTPRAAAGARSSSGGESGTCCGGASGECAGSSSGDGGPSCYLRGYGGCPSPSPSPDRRRPCRPPRFVLVLVLVPVVSGAPVIAREYPGQQQQTGAASSVPEAAAAVLAVVAVVILPAAAERGAALVSDAAREGLLDGAWTGESGDKLGNCTTWASTDLKFRIEAVLAAAPAVAAAGQRGSHQQQQQQQQQPRERKQMLALEGRGVSQWRGESIKFLVQGGVDLQRDSGECELEKQHTGKYNNTVEYRVFLLALKEDDFRHLERLWASANAPPPTAANNNNNNSAAAAAAATAVQCSCQWRRRLRGGRGGRGRDGSGSAALRPSGSSGRGRRGSSSNWSTATGTRSGRPTRLARRNLP